MIPFEKFPSVTGRRVYVAGCGREERDVLESKGYEVIDVLTLGRSSLRENQEAVIGWMTGISEGTIKVDPERRKMLEVEARVFGLLGAGSTFVYEHGETESDVGLEELLSLRNSTHTLQSSTLRGLLEKRKEDE